MTCWPSPEPFRDTERAGPDASRALAVPAPRGPAAPTQQQGLGRGGLACTRRLGLSPQPHWHGTQELPSLPSTLGDSPSKRSSSPSNPRRSGQTLSGKGQRVKTFGSVGHTRSLSHCSVLSLWCRSHQRQHMKGRAWLCPSKALCAEAGAGGVRPAGPAASPGSDDAVWDTGGGGTRRRAPSLAEHTSQCGPPASLSVPHQAANAMRARPACFCPGSPRLGGASSASEAVKKHLLCEQVNQRPILTNT